MTFNPQTYNWAACVPELLVTDFNKSREFYHSLGFKSVYERENFAYMEYQGAQFMIAQRNNWWETGSMERPFGRGVNFQFASNEVDNLITKLEKQIFLFMKRGKKNGVI